MLLIDKKSLGAFNMLDMYKNFQPLNLLVKQRSSGNTYTAISFKFTFTKNCLLSEFFMEKLIVGLEWF